MYIPYHGTIAFLGVYPRETVEYVLKDIYTEMFTTALCLKKKNQPRCPSTRVYYT